MLNRSITYRSLARILGVLALLLALFLAFRLATQNVGGDPLFIFLIVAHDGIPFIGVTGLLLLGVSLQRAEVAYWSLQLAIWLAGITLWYGSFPVLNPFPVDRTWIVVTALCSLVLLVLYKLMIRLFRHFLEGGINSSKGLTSDYT